MNDYDIFGHEWSWIEEIKHKKNKNTPSNVNNIDVDAKNRKAKIVKPQVIYESDCEKVPLLENFGYLPFPIAHIDQTITSIVLSSSSSIKIILM